MDVWRIEKVDPVPRVYGGDPKETGGRKIMKCIGYEKGMCAFPCNIVKQEYVTNHVGTSLTSEAVSSFSMKTYAEVGSSTDFSGEPVSPPMGIGCTDNDPAHNYNYADIRLSNGHVVHEKIYKCPCGRYIRETESGGSFSSSVCSPNTFSSSISVSNSVS